MDRRAFLAGVAAVAAGCSGGGTDATETATATDPTDSPTFVTPTEPATPDSRADDDVRQVIERAREASSTALERIDAAGVVEDGQPGILSEDGSAGRSEELSAAEELTVAARERLETVSADATGEQERAVGRLLRFTLYLRAKRFTHRSLLNAFLDYQVGRSAVVRRPKDATEAFQDGLRQFERAGSFRSRTADRLETVLDREGTVAVEGFDPEAERAGLEDVDRIIRQFRPSCRGLAAYSRSLRSIARAERAYREDEAPAEAAPEFRVAATHAEEARSAFRTAVDREIPTAATHRGLACQMTELREGAETAALGMEEFAAGNDDEGRELYQRARQQVRNAGETCADEETETR
jgi:hypothetical protein